MATRTEILPLREANGHHLRKCTGDTRYQGPLSPVALRDYRGVDDMIRAMEDDGFVVVRGVLDAAGVARMRAGMDRLGDQDDKAYRGWYYNKHVGNFFHTHPGFLDDIDREPVIDIADGVLGEDCRVIGGSAWITGKGRAMGLHVDYQPVGLPEDVMADPRVKVPPFICTAHYYLNDMTLDLGPTILIPGSHKAGRAPCDESTWNGRPPQALLVQAGDVMIFRSEIWHGAAMHEADERRYILQVHYGNVYIAGSVPPIADAARYHPDVLARATPRQRRLLGDKGSQLGRGSYTGPAYGYGREPR